METHRMIRSILLFIIIVVVVSEIFVLIFDPDRFWNEIPSSMLHLCGWSALLLFDIFYEKQKIYKETQKTVQMLLGKWENKFEETFLIVKKVDRNQYRITHNFPTYDRQVYVATVFFDKIYNKTCYCGDNSVFRLLYVSDDHITVRPDYSNDYPYRSITLYRSTS